MNFSRNYDDSQWIEETDAHYVFGRIRQKTVGLQTRVNYTITPRLSIQIYAEPFVSAGRLLRLQGAGRRPRTGLRGPVRAVRVHRQS